MRSILNKRPFFLSACIFVIGICYEQSGAIIFLLAAIGVVLYGIYHFWRLRKWRRFAVRSVWLLAVFLLSIGHMKAATNFRAKELSQIQKNETFIFQGEIYKKELKTYQVFYYLKDVFIITSNQMIACNDAILKDSDKTFSIGDTLTFYGKPNQFEEAANEGGFDEKSFYFSQKIDFYISDAKIQKQEETNGNAKQLSLVREKLKSVFMQCSSTMTAGALSAMLLGDKSSLNAEIKELYQESGISHILAISGLHVSLIGMSFYRFLRKRGIPYSVGFVSSCLFLMAYVVMSGDGVATRRACGMLIIAMLADVIGRSYDALNALGFMVMLLLLENPFLLEYAGFCFSVIAMVGVLIVGNLFQMPRRTEEKISWKKRCVNALYAATGVWLTTLPLVAYYYYEIPMYSVFLNMVVIPLLSFLFFFAIIGVLIGVFLPFVANIVLLPCSLILKIYEVLADISLQLPFGNIIVGKPSLLKIVIYYVLLSLICIWLFYRKEGHGKRIVGMFVLIVLMLSAPRDTFTLSVLDVGQGDGIYLCTNEGEHIFIDGGSSDVSQVGKYRILPFLKENGIRHIDYWFVSHADEDHISGLKEVLESGYQVENLILSKAATMQKDEKTMELIAFAELYDTNILYMKAGESLMLKESEIKCLAPMGNMVGTEDRNALSLVLMYQDKQFRGLFTGDISETEEKQLLESKVCQNVDFYKVSHHGSKFSSSEEFLDIIQPDMAVISCGKENRYGHPHKETLERLDAVGCRVWITAKCGQIKISVDKGMIVQIWKNSDDE